MNIQKSRVGIAIGALCSIAGIMAGLNRAVIQPLVASGQTLPVSIGVLRWGAVAILIAVLLAGLLYATAPPKSSDLRRRAAKSPQGQDDQDW